MENKVIMERIFVVLNIQVRQMHKDKPLVISVQSICLKAADSNQSCLLPEQKLHVYVYT